ncbi:imm11 family protein [Pseudomonas graminis]|nr:DUF1629 domain-containing protein [Pseudomonas graminis]
MVKAFIMQISDTYPESYWFKSKILTGQDSIELKTGAEVTGTWALELRLDKRVSLERVLGFDFLFSDGPNFISPRLYDILVSSNISGLQFIDADIYIKGKEYKGYKVVNTTNALAAFDSKNSKCEPLLSYIPDGPKKYTDIVLKKDISPAVDIFRAEEDFTVMLAVERVKQLFDSNQIVGVQFKDRLVKNSF